VAPIHIICPGISLYVLGVLGVIFVFRAQEFAILGPGNSFIDNNK